jgi:hypothetical protein
MRLQEFVIEMLDEDFRKHGHEVLERVRAKWPQVYLTAVINLMPKQTQTETVSQLEHHVPLASASRTGALFGVCAGGLIVRPDDD